MSGLDVSYVPVMWAHIFEVWVKEDQHVQLNGLFLQEDHVDVYGYVLAGRDWGTHQHWEVPLDTNLRVWRRRHED